MCVWMDVYVYACLYVCTHVMTQMPKDNLQKSFWPSSVDTRNQTLVARAGGRHIYLWHQFAGPLNQLHSLNPWYSGEIHGTLLRKKKSLSAQNKMQWTPQIHPLCQKSY